MDVTLVKALRNDLQSALQQTKWPSVGSAGSCYLPHLITSFPGHPQDAWVLCAVNKQAQQTGQELLDQVASAERERAAAPDEVPLGQWEAMRVRPDYDGALTSQALLASSEEAQDLLQACSLMSTIES